MNYFSILGFVAGGLQFGVAAYALRLNRLFGTARVGWSLFCAFALLALLHLVQAVTPIVNVSQETGIKIEVVYTLVSLLLLTGMVHMESLLKERLRIARQELQMRVDLESEVKKKTAYMMRAIEELQDEIDTRKRMEAQMEKSNTELYYANEQVKAAASVNDALSRMINTLKSVELSAGVVSDQMKQSKIANVVRMGNLIREHAANLGDFMSSDPRGQKLPLYIAQLAEHLANEQTILTQELASIKTNIEGMMALQPAPVRAVQATVAPVVPAMEEPAPAGFISF